MAVGIKKSALVGIPCKIEEARLCPECVIVTERETCPLCERLATVPHPEVAACLKRNYDFCVGCGGEFPSDQLRVLTWSFSPYDQSEGDLVCQCRECLEKTKDVDPQAVWKE